MSLGTCSFPFVCYSCHWSPFVIPITVALTKPFSPVAAAGLILHVWALPEPASLHPLQCTNTRGQQPSLRKFSPSCKPCPSQDPYSLVWPDGNAFLKGSPNSLGAEPLGSDIVPSSPPFFSKPSCGGCSKHSLTFHFVPSPFLNSTVEINKKTPKLKKKKKEQTTKQKLFIPSLL